MAAGEEAHEQAIHHRALPDHGAPHLGAHPVENAARALDSLPALRPQASRADVLEARTALAGVYVDDKLQEYVLDLVAATRRPRDFGLALDTLVAFGASPRATLFLVRAAQAIALIAGRPYTLPEDVKAIALDVLRHRIHVSYEAEAEGVDGEEVARRILEQVRVP